MMRKNSSFVFKSYTVVNHLTDVVDYDDDLRHVIRHYLADEVDFQEGNFSKLRKTICILFSALVVFLWR